MEFGRFLRISIQIAVAKVQQPGLVHNRIGPWSSAYSASRIASRSKQSASWPREILRRNIRNETAGQAVRDGKAHSRLVLG